jgi:uracil-DNA glycosylase
MATDFCPGYGAEPFRTLVRECPGEEVFPKKHFRVEWGPIFHRGRLDGSARLLVIGQDPGQHENVVRRVLVGRAGWRVQGLLEKLALDGRYVIINAFAYSVYGQHGGDANVADAAIAAYRHRWLDALFATSEIAGVIALGTIAERSWKRWKRTTAGKQVSPVFVRLIHPTAPEAIGKQNAAKVGAVTKDLLTQWNAALAKLAPALGLQEVRPYGKTWAEDEEQPIPARDFPAGLPAWMRQSEKWATRDGTTAAVKRRRILITAPSP